MEEIETLSQNEIKIEKEAELIAQDIAEELTPLSKEKVEISNEIDGIISEESNKVILQEKASEPLETIATIDHYLYKNKIDYSNIEKHYLISLIEERLNSQRDAQGLPILYQRRNLKDAAQDQNDYANELSALTHVQNSAKKSTVRDRVSHHGGRYMKVGENILYYGFLNNEVDGELFIFPPDYSEAADDIMEIWNESPSHYKNMMDKDFSSVGTALDWNTELKAIFVTQVYGG